MRRTYCHACHTGTSTDEARTNVNGVGVARFHVNWWEGRERTGGGLVVPGGLWARAAAWVVASEEE